MVPMLTLKLCAAAGSATEVAARARAGISSFLIMVVSFQRSSSGEATLTAQKQVAAEPKLNRPFQVWFIGMTSVTGAAGAGPVDAWLRGRREPD